MARRQDTQSSEGATSLNLSVSTAKHALWHEGARALTDADLVTVVTHGKKFPVSEPSSKPVRVSKTCNFARNPRTGSLVIGVATKFLPISTDEGNYDQDGTFIIRPEEALLFRSLNDLTSDIMADELTAFAEQYRRLLREGMATGEDRVVRDTLNRVRLQERLLDSVHLVSQKEACELLGMSKKNPSATMSRKEENGELLRFTRDGRAVYPLLQFDPDARRLYPEIKEMIAMAEGWRSHYQILSWLVRPHLDFDGTPAEALKTHGDAVIAAFARETAEQSHG